MFKINSQKQTVENYCAVVHYFLYALAFTFLLSSTLGTSHMRGFSPIFPFRHISACFDCRPHRVSYYGTL